MKLFKSLKDQALSFLEQYKQGSPVTYAVAEQAVGAILITDGLIGIDNPFGQNKRPGIFGTIFLIGFGMVFMFVPKFVGNLTNINNMTETTTATVLSVGSNTSTDDDTCSLSVEYLVDNKLYNKKSSMSSSSYCSLTEGQTITINYDPANPGSFAYDVKTVSGFLYIFFFAGLFAVLSGIVTFFIRLLSIFFGWKLLKDGRKNASNLPSDTNFQIMVNEIKKNFVASVFNFGGSANVNPSAKEEVLPRQPDQSTSRIVTNANTQAPQPNQSDQMNNQTGS